MEKDKNLFVV